MIKKVEKIISQYQRKYDIGFTYSEIGEILKINNIDESIFYIMLGTNTVTKINDEIVVYTCDVELALRCIIENRDKTFDEFD